jgi:hypothetical protein
MARAGAKGKGFVRPMDAVREVWMTEKGVARNTLGRGAALPGKALGTLC